MKECSQYIALSEKTTRCKTAVFYRTPLTCILLARLIISLKGQPHCHLRHFGLVTGSTITKSDWTKTKLLTYRKTVCEWARSSALLGIKISDQAEKSWAIRILF